MPRLALLSFFLLLAACASPDSVKDRQERLEQADLSECARLGFTQNGDALADCRLRMKEMRLQQRLSNSAVTFNPYRGTPDSSSLH